MPAPPSLTASAGSDNPKGEVAKPKEDAKENHGEQSNISPPCKSRPIAQVTEDLIAAMNEAKGGKKKRTKTRKGKKAANRKVKKASSKKEIEHSSDEEATRTKKSSNSKKGKKKVVCLQTKATAKTASGKPKWSKTPPKDLIQKFKGGCGRCRYAVGCTPSCWKKRGF